MSIEMLISTRNFHKGRKRAEVRSSGGRTNVKWAQVNVFFTHKQVFLLI